MKLIQIRLKSILCFRLLFIIFVTTSYNILILGSSFAMPQSAISISKDKKNQIASPKKPLLPKQQKVDPVSFLSNFEKGVVIEINKVRKNPSSYIGLLMDWRQKFRGNEASVGTNTYAITKEGPFAVEEAIQALQGKASTSPLLVSKGMSLAAKDHVREQSQTGETELQGRDGSTPESRINRYGTWEVATVYSSVYGWKTPQEVVRSLIISDGKPDRGSREALFNPRFRVVGLGCGLHPNYGVMCVIHYAVSYSER